MEAITWSSVVLYVIETMLGLIVTVGVPYLFGLIRAKFKGDMQEKYLAMTEQFVRDAVTQVQQTYVSELRKGGVFDKDAQARAFEMARDATLAMMNEKAKNIVVEAVGDFEAYLKSLIEANVYELKNNVAWPVVEEVA